MTYAQMKVDAQEMERRMGVIIRMNILWDKRNACDDAGKRKALDKKIDAIRRHETAWLKDVAWFLY